MLSNIEDTTNISLPELIGVVRNAFKIKKVYKHPVRIVNIIILHIRCQTQETKEIKAKSSIFFSSFFLSFYFILKQ
jgi:hypothetical protein